MADASIMTAEEWNTRNPVGTRVSWGVKSIRRFRDGTIILSLREYSRRTIAPAVTTATGLKVPVKFERKTKWVPVS